jgi:hypothetical protein
LKTLSAQSKAQRVSEAEKQGTEVTRGRLKQRSNNNKQMPKEK